MSVGADILSWGLIILGAVSMLVGGIGVLRFPDVYSRMHAASITDTLGAGALLLGLTIQAGVTLVAVKLIMMLAFFFFTGPTSSFSLAHAALSSGVEPILDSDLREDSEKDPEIKEKLS
ncbi:MAG: monovalent cation/H(+) antiporter subunit G [Proteobacteria bacterium]|nr:monovalent cation/H(+) antiporter subunit G [Pseudomonadota bacterium]MDA1323567.1 monovalent cation/H(+) antiporter subunit G [Pseudomonadota bacterium]